MPRTDVYPPCDPDNVLNDKISEYDKLLLIYFYFCDPNYHHFSHFRFFLITQQRKEYCFLLKKLQNSHNSHNIHKLLKPFGPSLPLHYAQLEATLPTHFYTNYEHHLCTPLPSSCPDLTDIYSIFDFFDHHFNLLPHWAGMVINEMKFLFEKNEFERIQNDFLRLSLAIKPGSTNILEPSDAIKASINYGFDQEEPQWRKSIRLAKEKKDFDHQLKKKMGSKKDGFNNHQSMMMNPNSFRNFDLDEANFGFFSQSLEDPDDYSSDLSNVDQKGDNDATIDVSSIETENFEIFSQTRFNLKSSNLAERNLLKKFKMYLHNQIMLALKPAKYQLNLHLDGIVVDGYTTYNPDGLNTTEINGLYNHFLVISHDEVSQHGVSEQQNYSKQQNLFGETSQVEKTSSFVQPRHDQKEIFPDITCLVWQFVDSSILERILADQLCTNRYDQKLIQYFAGEQEKIDLETVRETQRRILNEKKTGQNNNSSRGRRTVQKRDPKNNNNQQFMVNNSNYFETKFTKIVATRLYHRLRHRRQISQSQPDISDKFLKLKSIIEKVPKYQKRHKIIQNNEQTIHPKNHQKLPKIQKKIPPLLHHPFRPKNHQNHPTREFGLVHPNSSKARVDSGIRRHTTSKVGKKPLKSGHTYFFFTKKKTRQDDPKDNNDQISQNLDSNLNKNNQFCNQLNASQYGPKIINSFETLLEKIICNDHDGLDVINNSQFHENVDQKEQLIARNDRNKSDRNKNKKSELSELNELNDQNGSPNSAKKTPKNTKIGNNNCSPHDESSSPLNPIHSPTNSIPFSPNYIPAPTKTLSSPNISPQKTQNTQNTQKTQNIQIKNQQPDTRSKKKQNPAKISSKSNHKHNNNNTNQNKNPNLTTKVPPRTNLLSSKADFINSINLLSLYAIDALNDEL
jgi:hypothetical protein